jgi:hypothetical protein
MDLLTYDLSTIHPSYCVQERPPSRQPKILWPNFPSPPKHYWKSWHHFLHQIVTPLIQTLKLSWSTTPPRYNIIFFKHRQHFQLYRIVGTDVTCFCLQRRTRYQAPTTYHNVPYESDLDPTRQMKFFSQWMYSTLAAAYKFAIHL